MIVHKYFLFFSYVLICAGLKEKVPKGSGIIKECCFVAVGVAFLEEVFHCGGGV